MGLELVMRKYMYELLSEGYKFRKALKNDRTKEIFGIDHKEVAIAYKRENDVVSTWYTYGREPFKMSELSSVSYFESLDYHYTPQHIEAVFSPNAIKLLWQHIDTCDGVNHYDQVIDDEMIAFMYNASLYRAYHFNKDIKIGFAKQIYEDIYERLSFDEQLETDYFEEGNNVPYNKDGYTPVKGLIVTWKPQDIADYVNRIMSLSLTLEEYEK